MTKQIKILTLSVFVMFTIVGCGGSSSNKSVTPEIPISEPEQPQTPVVIEDISCDVIYPLSIAAVNIENDNNNLLPLFDGDKTNASVWQAPALDTTLIIELNDPALIRQLVITWQNLANSHRFSFYASKDGNNWQLLDSQEESTSQAIIPDIIDLAASASEAYTAKYIKAVFAGDELSQPSSLLEIEAFGCEENVSHSVELIDWYLSVPTDEDNNNKSDSIKENDLADGYFDSRFFLLSPDSGLIFNTSVSGFRTSENTKYVRSELREMLRRGNTSHSTQGVNKNNWVFSSAPQSAQDNAGGVDGTLNAELAVNKVTTTGEDYQIGRVIIGQIHANNDEPARLYYRKLPNNENGAIYLAHELLDGDDIYYEILGSRSNSASNPQDGIPLNERFSYTIEVVGHTLTVTIIKSDGSQYIQDVDMSDSGYDDEHQYMYFKAGVYNQNNSGDPHDYVKATFYKIDNSHQ